ncbi:hypothetical protein MAR_ORF312 [Marseillevirus marseillevirus]|uniref:Uncharacterized protein n=1 Tax=Marseillevirus marseillevirus TaxID=694581 RepID=D2XAV7_GBMV|nr:hypothetical protein MAR_ORF312 [Marseillevirus marseillevirus]ADB04084.1 hypothetical protein MAR_ORF312 [Marseillevirus marseillevirus]
MTDTGKCTDKAIASCKKQGKLCNVETARCVSADPKRKVKGAVYDKKRSLYFPQGLLFEDEDGSQELVSPKKKSPPKKRLAKKKVSPKKKTPSPKKKSSPKKKKAVPKKKKETSSEEESEEELPKKKAVKKTPSKKAACFEEDGSCPTEKPICSVSEKGRGTCIKGSQKTLASKSMIKHSGLTIVGSSEVLKKLRKDYEHLEGDIKKWKEEESEEEPRKKKASKKKKETSSEEESEEELPKKKTPPKKRLAKKKVSPKKKSPPKKKKATPKKKSANEELLCFEEEAEPCEDGEVCSATGKCVPKTTAFLRKKKKIPLHGKEVYGTELQFKNLSKKYADVSKARKYEVEEEIRIEAPKQASPAIKKTAKKIEEVVEEADLSEEVKQVIVEGIEAALAEGHKEEKREEKGKEKEEEEPKKKSGSGRKKKKVSLPESESRQVEKSAEEIQQEFERCLGIQVSGL